MNIELTPELEQLVQNKLQTGSYNSASDIFIEAMHLLDDRDIAKDEVRQKIADGMESLRQGKGVDGEDFMEQMITELDEQIRIKDKQANRNSPSADETLHSCAASKG